MYKCMGLWVHVEVEVGALVFLAVIRFVYRGISKSAARSLGL